MHIFSVCSTGRGFFDCESQDRQSSMSPMIQLGLGSFLFRDRIVDGGGVTTAVAAPLPNSVRRRQLRVVLVPSDGAYERRGVDSTNCIFNITNINFSFFFLLYEL